MSGRQKRRPRHFELPDELIEQTEAFRDNARLPAQYRLLNFRDANLEGAYLSAEHRRNRKYYLVSNSIAVALVASFLWADRFLLPADMLAIFRIARVYVILPVALVILLTTLVIANSRVWLRVTIAFVTAFGLAWPTLLLVAGSGAFPYLQIATLQVILATLILYGSPVRWSIPLAAVIGVYFGVAARHVGVDDSAMVGYAIDYSLYGFMGSAAAFRYERASRKAFVSQLLSRKEYSERLGAEADRRRWLEVIAAFLRHELKNSMTAISSSIDMAERATLRSEAGKYLDRGQRSVMYMRQLLTKVADATSLESALAQTQFEALDFSTLVLDRIQDFREDTGGWRFEVVVETDLWVLGHGDSLVQMLDKLLNNAMEHGDPAFPIQIELRDRDGWCVLCVTDVGDALPADIEQMFEPFATHKTRRGDEVNLGLGLFIAHTIAVGHGGSISVEALTQAVGARFVVRLRSAARGVSGGKPPIAATAFGANSIEAGVDS